jgi:hypothetical protein
VVILREDRCGTDLGSGSDPFVATTEDHINLLVERKLVDGVAELTGNKAGVKSQKGFHIGGLNLRGLSL